MTWSKKWTQNDNNNHNNKSNREIKIVQLKNI